MLTNKFVCVWMWNVNSYLSHMWSNAFRLWKVYNGCDSPYVHDSYESNHNNNVNFIYSTTAPNVVFLPQLPIFHFPIRVLHSDPEIFKVKFICLIDNLIHFNDEIAILLSSSWKLFGSGITIRIISIDATNI